MIVSTDRVHVRRRRIAAVVAACCSFLMLVGMWQIGRAVASTLASLGSGTAAPTRHDTATAGAGSPTARTTSSAPSRSHPSPTTAPPALQSPALGSASATSTASASPTTSAAPSVPADRTTMRLAQRITGSLTPKAVGIARTGIALVPNTLGRHSISVIRADGRRVTEIPDAVTLAEHGISGHSGTSRGNPFEVAFSPDGRTAFVANYSMSGRGFGPAGEDACTTGDKVSPSFVYQVDVSSLRITRVLPAGAAPKYVAVTPDGKRVLVANWCSDDLSVIDIASGAEIARVGLGGHHPRGIAVAQDSRTAYVALMASDRIVRVNLGTLKASAFSHPGGGPRDLLMAPDQRSLIVAQNGLSSVSRITVRGGTTTDHVDVGSQPRAMAMSADGRAVYVVTYAGREVVKLRTADLKILDRVRVDARPVGVSYDPTRHRVWVACESGSVLVLDDSRR